MMCKILRKMQNKIEFSYIIDVAKHKSIILNSTNSILSKLIICIVNLNTSKIDTLTIHYQSYHKSTVEMIFPCEINKKSITYH